jgi:hypothetical protein
VGIIGAVEVGIGCKIILPVQNFNWIAMWINIIYSQSNAQLIGQL